MLTIARDLAAKGWLWWTRQQGPERFYEVCLPHYASTLRAISDANYGLTITVERRTVRQLRGRRGLSWTRAYTTYRISSVPVGTVSEAFAQACTLVLTIPRPLPWFCYEQHQHNRAFEIYLGVLVSQLKS